MQADTTSKAASEPELGNSQSHRTKQLDALPIYLQSRHLIKKAGTKDIALEDLSLLAPDNTELLANTELRLTHARRYGLIGRNGIGKSTLLRAISSTHVLDRTFTCRRSSIVRSAFSSRTYLPQKCVFATRSQLEQAP